MFDASKVQKIGNHRNRNIESIIYKSQIMTFIILSFIITNCHAQNSTLFPLSTTMESTTIPPPPPQAQILSTAFYEDLETLKWIAIGALCVLICCCLALILFVRSQVRKTEQGTEIQKYIRKRRESEVSQQISKNNPLKFTPSVSHQNVLANHVSNNSVFQFDPQNLNTTRPPMVIAATRSASIGGVDGVPAIVNNVSNPQLSHMTNSFDVNDIVSPSNATPGALFALDDDKEVEKELYLVKIAEQNEMKQKFEVMHKESLYENQAEEDEDFGQILNDAMQFQQNQQDKIFNDMASEQYKNEQNNVQQQQQQHKKQRTSSHGSAKGIRPYRYSQHRSNKSNSVHSHHF